MEMSHFECDKDALIRTLAFVWTGYPLVTLSAFKAEERKPGGGFNATDATASLALLTRPFDLHD